MTERTAADAASAGPTLRSLASCDATEAEGDGVRGAGGRGGEDDEGGGRGGRFKADEVDGGGAEEGG